MIKRFAAIGQSTLATCLAAAFAWGLIESALFVGSGIGSWTLGEVALSLVSIFGVAMLASSVIGCALTVVLFAVFGMLSRFKSASPEHFWSAGVDLVLGPPGKSLGGTVAPIVAYAGLVWTLLPRMHGVMLRLSDFPGVLAIVAAHAVCAVLVGAVYRLVIALRPKWRGHRWVFAIGAAGVAYFLVVGPIREMDPLGLLPFVIFVVSVFAVAARLVLDDFRRAGWMPERLLAMRGPMAVAGLGLAAATLIFYPPSQSVHSATVLQTRLVSPALALVRLGLDLDGDMHSGQLAGGDCDSFDAEVHPDAPEVPGNGKDDNCTGGDLAAEGIPSRPAKLAPLALSGDTPSPPNIIFITVDTLRDDYVGKRIGDRSLTPNMDRLAAESVRFNRTYAPSTNTKETFPSVMTGQYPSDWHQQGLYFGLDRTLPEIFDELGFETLAVMSIPGLRHEIVAGFEEVDNRLAKINRPRDGVTSAQTTELALSKLDGRDADRPLFLWVHYFDPHAYYVEEERFADWLGRGTQPRAYAHEVARTDEAVGQLLDGLEERGYFDDSVVALFSDHGESLSEHNMIGHLWAAYEEIVRVPFLLRLPGVGPGERDQTVSLIDLFPTLIEYFGVEGVEPRAARSLMPLLESEKAQSERWTPRPVFIEVADVGRPVLRGVVDGRHKLVFDRHRLAYSLYDLESDPAEARNLVGSDPQLFEELRAELAGWWDRQYNTARLEQKLQRDERLEPTRPARLRGEFIGP